MMKSVLKLASNFRRMLRSRKFRKLRSRIKALNTEGVANKFLHRLSIGRNSPRMKKWLAAFPASERVHVERLFSTNNIIRLDAVGALRDLNSKGSVPVLERVALRDSSVDVRLGAVYALGVLNSKGSVSVLERVARHNSIADVCSAAARVLRDLFPDDARWHRLYAGQDEAKFFDRSKSFVGRTFGKTGSRMVLLGGKLAGKAVVRYVSPSAFAAWRKALDAGVAVEPILMRDKRLRVSKGVIEKSSDELKVGKVRVVSKVLGPSVANFLSVSKNEKQFGSIVREQVEKIKRDLARLGIVHGHLHDLNFCIHWEKDSSGKRFPKVYLIDFDRAVSQ